MDSENLSKADLELLATKIGKLRRLLSNFTGKQQIETQKLEKQNFELKMEVENLRFARDHWRARYGASMQERDDINMKLVDMQAELVEMCKQVNDLTEYSCHQGTTLSRMIWKVCGKEDAVNALLVGHKFDHFLRLICTTLENYIHLYKQDPLHLPEDSRIWDFALCLMGIFTNVSAFATGRQFIMTSEAGKQTVDILFMFLSDMPPQKVTKLKNLILSALHNLTLNSLGKQYVSCHPNNLTVIIWHLQEESIPENRANCLLLLEALLLEQVNASLLLTAKELGVQELLVRLSRDSNAVVRERASNLLLSFTNNDLTGQ